MIKAPNGDILIDKKITGIENLLELIIDTTGLKKGDIRIDESTIREVSEKDRNTAVDVEITKGGHTNRVVAYYNRVSLAEIGNVEAEKNNDAVLNYIDGENGDFSTAFNDKDIKTKLKQTVADRVNIPSDEIIVESIDYSKKYEGCTSITFKMNGDDAKTVKGKFTVKSWYVPPIYIIDDVDFRNRIGTPKDFNTLISIEVNNDKDIVIDHSRNVEIGYRKASNPLFFPKGSITDFESTNYEFGNTDEELIGYLVDGYHTREIQDSVNNKYEIAEVKQLENGFSKVWVENKNKDIIDRNGFYKIRQFNPELHVQRVRFLDGTSDSAKYVHGYIEARGRYNYFFDDSNKRHIIFYSKNEGHLIYPIGDLLSSLGLRYDSDLDYLDPDRGTPPPAELNIPKLTDVQKRGIEDYFKTKKKYDVDGTNIEGAYSIGLFNLKYGQVFKFERKERDYGYNGGESGYVDKIYGTAKIIQYKSGDKSVFDRENKTYYSHSNYGKLYIDSDSGLLIYFAKMISGSSYSDEETREEKELVEREIFNRYGLPYDKITIDWDKTIASNFNEIFYSIKPSVTCKGAENNTITVYKRAAPNFIGTPAISADIRYINGQRIGPLVGTSRPSEIVIQAPKDKVYTKDFYYFSKG